MRPSKERRQWDRLALGMPMFVRGTDPEGRSFTELAVALNISSGGALVALRHPVSAPGSITLEVPRPPIPNIDELVGSEAQSIDADIVRSEKRNGSQLVGVRFSRQLPFQHLTFA